MITKQQLANFSERQCKDYLSKYYNQNFNQNRLYMLIPFNSLVALVSFKITHRWHQISRFIKIPNRTPIRTLFLSLMFSSTFVTTLLLGNFLVSGTNIQKLKNYYTIHWNMCQKSDIFNKSNYERQLGQVFEKYKISQQNQRRVFQEIQQRQQKLINENYFSDETLERIREWKEEQQQEKELLVKQNQNL